MLLIHCELFFFVSPDVVYGCVPLTFTYIKLMMCIDLLCVHPAWVLQWVHFTAIEAPQDTRM